MNTIIFQPYTPNYREVARRVFPSWKRWAQTQGHSYVPMEMHWAGEPQLFTFEKMRRVADLIDANPWRRLLVVDADMLVTNGSTFMPIFNFDVTLFPDINGPNTGILSINCTPQAREAIQCVIDWEDGGAESEQRAFWNLIESCWRPDVLHVAHTGQNYNCIPYEEYSYGYQATHSSQWQHGSFTCHLPGMDPAQKLPLFDKYEALARD